MKAMLGVGLVLLFVAGIAFMMFEGRQLAAQNMPAGGSEYTGVIWRPVSIGDEPVPEESHMFVEFGMDGSIRGHGGCNSFFGSLENSEDGITIGPLGSTRMACPEPIMNREMAFMDALQRSTQVDVSATHLHLIGEDDVKLVELVPGGEDPAGVVQ